MPGGQLPAGWRWVTDLDGQSAAAAAGTGGGLMAAGTAARRDTASELAWLTRALKAPTLREAVHAGWPSGPGPNPGVMRSSWPRACSGR